MKLTRRDALKAIAIGGGAAGTSLAVSESLVGGTETSETDGYANSDIEVVLLVADVVYPSSVEVTREFVETYVRRLDATRQAELSKAVTELNQLTKTRYGRSFSETSSADRRAEMLRSLGVNRVESSPNGTVPQRVRYHLVNTLLYALFTSPAGSELVGIDSPVGHPGGFARYQVNDE